MAKDLAVEVAQYEKGLHEVYNTLVKRGGLLTPALRLKAKDVTIKFLHDVFVKQEEEEKEKSSHSEEQKDTEEKKKQMEQYAESRPGKRRHPVIERPANLAWLHLMVEDTACYFCNDETMQEVMYGGQLKKVCPTCQETCIEEDDDMLDVMSEILKERKFRTSMAVPSK